MLNFNGLDIGPTRASERTHEIKLSKQELAKKMVELYHNVEEKMFDDVGSVRGLVDGQRLIEARCVIL